MSLPGEWTGDDETCPLIGALGFGAIGPLNRRAYDAAAPVVAIRASALVGGTVFQPRAKLEFIRRYCSPKNGWRVCVDIDPSEEGRTGGIRRSNSSIELQARMQADAMRIKKALGELGATLGRRSHWCHLEGIPHFEGDPDIVAYDRQNNCVIAKVEGESSGQPEQKVYKAIGQMVRTVSNLPPGWHSRLVIVVYGDKISAHLQRAHALAKLGISGLSIANEAGADRWLFGEPL